MHIPQGKKGADFKHEGTARSRAREGSGLPLRDQPAQLFQLAAQYLSLQAFRRGGSCPSTIPRRRVMTPSSISAGKYPGSFSAPVRRKAYIPCQAGCGEMTPERYGGEIRRIPLRSPMFPTVFRHRPEAAAGHPDRKADFLTETLPEANRFSFSEIPDCAK